jgi:tetratricopeptide (TPR) repeat protein
MWSEGFQSNWDKVVEIGNRILATDSANMDVLANVGVGYLFLEEYEKSLKYFERLIDRMNATGKKLDFVYEWIGYAFWKNGEQESADFYMSQKLEILDREFENQKRYNVFQRAAIFAFRGMKEEALADLSEYYNVKNIHQDQLLWIKFSPLFDNIRDEPEFQQIVKDVEAKYQAGHERVRKWLEENDML